MANVKISALPAVTTVVPGTDVLPLVSGGITTKATPTQIVSAALNNPQVISVNSASDALRITQVGAGNALLVEDSANPDSTPFVVDAAGRVIVGTTASVTVGGSSARSVQVSGTANDATIAVMGYSNSTTGAGTGLILARSRGAASGDFTTLQNGDLVSQINFVGADGTTLNSIAATIETRVDGVPGTNDMPGRLVFSTTKDGASIPTEAMRIDSSQQVGFGGTPLAGSAITLRKDITGAATAYGIISLQTIQSDVTSAATIFRIQPSTAAATFTTPNLRYYMAVQGTIGAGSSVTAQFGYFADASLTGATNNYGFYSNIASGTGRYNFYAAGTAANYFAGDLTIYGGTAVPAGGTAGVGYKFSSTSNLGVFFGSGAPTLAAAQGSLYVRTDGSSTSTRLYVNTNGSTTWTNVTTAA